MLVSATITHMLSHLDTTFLLVNIGVDACFKSFSSLRSSITEASIEVGCASPYHPRACAGVVRNVMLCVYIPLASPADVLRVRHAFLPHCGAETRDEPLRTSAWEADIQHLR